MCVTMLPVLREKPWLGQCSGRGKDTFLSHGLAASEKSVTCSASLDYCLQAGFFNTKFYILGQSNTN